MLRRTNVKRGKNKGKDGKGAAVTSVETGNGTDAGPVRPGGRRRWIGTAAALLAGGGLQLSRYYFLTRAPFLRGADAYYYALQIRALRELGKLLIPDASLLFPLMAFTCRAGLGYEQTVNLWMVLIQLAGALNLFLASRWMAEQNKDRPAAGGLLFLWALLSPTFLFTCIEFPKYALGLAFLPLWPVGLVNRRYWPVSVGALLLACLTHRACFGFAGLAAAGLLFALWRKKGRGWVVALLADWGRKRVLLAAGGLLLLVIAFGLIIAQGSYFSWADFTRFNWEEMQPSFLTFLRREGIPLALKAESVLAMVVAGLLLWRRGRGKDDGRPVAAGLWWPFLLFLLVFPLGSTEIMGIPERLSLALPLVTLVLLAGGGLPGDAGRCAPFSWRRTTVGWVLLVLTLTGLVSPGFCFSLAHPERLDPDYGLYEEVTMVLAGLELPMVIAHRGLNFYYKYRTLREAFHYEPEAHWPKELVWRVAYGITPAEWAAYLPPDCRWESGKLITLPGPYSLVREDVWHRFREAVRQSGDEYLQERVLALWLNPSQRRPGFLYEKHQSGADEGVFSALPR